VTFERGDQSGRANPCVLDNSVANDPKPTLQNGKQLPRIGSPACRIHPKYRIAERRRAALVRYRHRRDHNPLRKFGSMSALQRKADIGFAGMRALFKRGHSRIK
jgi:hypothetical protein